MNPEKVKEHMPLWRYEYVEGVRGRDGGSAHADPYNDIVKSRQLRYYSKKSDTTPWELEYTQGCGDFAYASAQAVMTLGKLQERSGPGEDAIMFEYKNTMFNITTHCYDQKCVCGASVKGKYINEYEGDDSVKVDYLDTYISFYKRDTLVVKPHGLYFNGKVFCREDLEIEDFSWLKTEDYQTLEKEFSGIKAVSTWSSWESIR